MEDVGAHDAGEERQQVEHVTPERFKHREHTEGMLAKCFHRRVGGGTFGTHRWGEIFATEHRNIQSLLLLRAARLGLLYCVREAHRSAPG